MILLHLISVLFLSLGLCSLTFTLYLIIAFHATTQSTAVIFALTLGSVYIVLGILGFLHTHLSPLIPYIALLLALLSTHITTFVLLEQKKFNAEYDLGLVWASMTPQARGQVEHVLECCGWQSPLDNPGDQCVVMMGCYGQMDRRWNQHKGVFYVVAAVLMFLNLVALVLGGIQLVRIWPRSKRKQYV